MSSPPDEIARLRDQLAEAAEREGEFRLKSAEDFLGLKARLRAQDEIIAQRDTHIHELHLAANERDRYIHELHVERNALRGDVQARHDDIEALTWMLDAASADPGPTGAPDAPGASFSYHLHTSPFRIYRGPRFLLRGWAVPADGRAITAVRARVDDAAFPGRCGLAEPQIAAHPGAQAANPNPGFEIEFATPPGRHRLRLEAQLEGREWCSILNLPIWCQPRPNAI